MYLCIVIFYDKNKTATAYRLNCNRLEIKIISFRDTISSEAQLGIDSHNITVKTIKDRQYI